MKVDLSTDEILTLMAGLHSIDVATPGSDDVEGREWFVKCRDLWEKLYPLVNGGERAPCFVCLGATVIPSGDDDPIICPECKGEY